MEQPCVPLAQEALLATTRRRRSACAQAAALETLLWLEVRNALNVRQAPALEAPRPFSVLRLL